MVVTTSGFVCPRAVNMSGMAGIGDVLEWARHQVVSRVPKADLDQRDPDYIRDQLPGLWLLASVYFRADVRGLDRIPAEGPVLLVGNHSGGNLPPDTFVFTLAFCTYFGVERPFYQLAHNLVVSAPPLGYLRKFGTVAANHENAQLALKSGAALLVYPGGDYEVFRLSWERQQVDFGGRKGYLRLAREASVPIVCRTSFPGDQLMSARARRNGTDERSREEATVLMRVQRRCVIDANRDDVWKVVSDPDCYPTFMANLARWETVTDGPVRVGSRYTVHWKMARCRWAGSSRWWSSTSRVIWRGSASPALRCGAGSGCATPARAAPR